jgi:hypothetical protein
MTAAALWTLAKTWGDSLLTWIAKPPGSYIALALAALIGLWAVHHHGYAAGYADCTAERNAIATIEIRRQETVGAAVVTRAEVEAAADTAKDRRNRETIRYVVKTIAARPDADAECIPAAVADGMRNLE